MKDLVKSEIVEHVISIRNPYYPGSIYSNPDDIAKLDAKIEYAGFQSKLILEFDDVLDAEDGTVFTYDNARQVLEFIKGKEHSNFAIHCWAGRSRSVAIGRFLKDFYDAEVKYESCSDDSGYNVTVYNALKRVFLGIEDL